jgi:hypothetical protein
MHHEMEKVEEKKYVEKYLLKHNTALSEGSKQREATSNKKNKNIIYDLFKIV